MEALLIVGFVTLWCATMLWLFLCHRLFKLLRQKHPGKFLQMGEPNLTENNTLGTNIRLFKYLYHREWKSLDDARLANLSAVMRNMMLALAICFVLVFASVPYFAVHYS